MIRIPGIAEDTQHRYSDRVSSLRNRTVLPLRRPLPCQIRDTGTSLLAVNGGISSLFEERSYPNDLAEYRTSSFDVFVYVYLLCVDSDIIPAVLEFDANGNLRLVDQIR